MIARESLGRVGVVANPAAGAGASALRAVLEKLLPALCECEIVVSAGTVESGVADAGGARCRRIHGPSGASDKLAQALLDAGVDTIIGVGGDGTLGEIAAVLATAGAKTPLLGIGVGSSNVGPLVAASADGVEALLASPWREVPIHALEARGNDQPIGLAFHDAVAATTFFATRCGRRIDLDAQAALRNEDRTACPISVCGVETWVAKNGRRRLSGADLEGGQVVASPLNDVETCRGKAVSGFLCWGPYVGCLGVVAAASSLMIRTRLEREDLEDAEPLRMFHLGMAAEDVVEMSGFLEGAALVLDGTPRCAVMPATIVSLRILEEAVVCIRRGDPPDAASGEIERKADG